MRPVLVDSNVLLDIITDDPRWGPWSAEQLATLANETQLVINPIIFSEVSIGFLSLEDAESALSEDTFLREDLPWAAAFLAGKAFLSYRKRQGKRTSLLPDFYIGAHALSQGYRLLTRDRTRYETYFPDLALVTPPY